MLWALYIRYIIKISNHATTPLPLIPVDAVNSITMVDVLNFSRILFCTLKDVEDCKDFKISLANFLCGLLGFDKLNTYQEKNWIFQFFKSSLLSGPSISFFFSPTTDVFGTFVYLISMIAIICHVSRNLQQYERAK